MCTQAGTVPDTHTGTVALGQDISTETDSAIIVRSDYKDDGEALHCQCLGMIVYWYFQSESDST